MHQLVLDVIHGIRSLKHTIKVLAPNAPSGARYAVAFSHHKMVGCRKKQGLMLQYFSNPSDVSVEILCKDESVLTAVNQALRDIEGQCRISVHASIDGGVSASAAGPVLTHSVSESCRGERDAESWWPC